MATKKVKLTQTRKEPPTLRAAVLFLLAAVVLLAAGLTVMYFHNTLPFNSTLALANSLTIIVYLFAIISFGFGVWQAIALYFYRKKGRELDKKRKFNRPKKKR